jgi:hypothetical protein
LTLVALVEVELGLGRDHAGKVEDHVGPRGNRLFGLARR